VKKLLKSVYIYGSYRKIKTGLSLFLDHSVYRQKLPSSSTALSLCPLTPPTRGIPANIHIHLYISRN